MRASLLARLLALAAVTGFALAVSPGRASAAEDAGALMAKHAAYVGWHAGDGVVKTLKQTGEATRDGKVVRSFSLLRYGGAYRETFEYPNGLHYDEGFTGTIAWASNENGFTVRALGEVVRAQFSIDALFAETTATPEFTAALHGTGKVDGTEYPIVRLTSKVSLPIDAWVDPATGAYRRVVIDPDGKYEDSFDGLGYSEVGGKRFLTAWRHGDSKVRSAYTRTEPNAKIEPDELRPPKQTATWTFGKAPAQIEYTDQPVPRIYIDLLVNGRKGKFILDTGAANTAVVDSFLRAAGGKRFGTTAITGIGGNESRANLFRIDTLAVGDSTLHDVVVSSGLDEQDFQRMGVAGIVGFDLLAGAIAELSLDAKTLHVMDPAKVAPDEHAGLVVHVDLSDFHIRTPMRLDDKYDVIATLDSGNPADVLFSRDLIKRDKLDFTTRYEAYIYGLGGSELAHCGKLKSLSLGPVRYTTPTACDSPSFARNEILVGLDFMRAFNYVFDYPDGLVVMIPRKNY
ncbi:MAG: Aspartyl protease [Candidatus Eremiobacteraeota bacterium]|nr:Aspartyl protease [Candidatus Eremiobacteraeota bacterium]